MGKRVIYMDKYLYNKSNIKEKYLQKFIKDICDIFLSMVIVTNFVSVLDLYNIIYSLKIRAQH